jgi:hypothetical protein
MRTLKLTPVVVPDASEGIRLMFPGRDDLLIEKFKKVNFPNKLLHEGSLGQVIKLPPLVPYLLAGAAMFVIIRLIWMSFKEPRKFKRIQRKFFQGV